MGPNPNAPIHGIYIHKKYGTEFLHDFPSNIELAKALPPIYERYKRRISHFLAHFRQKQKILLVFISSDKQDLNLLQSYIAALNKKYFPAQIFLLYITHNATLSMEQTIETSLGENCYYVQINNSATNHADSFLALQGNIPLVSDIICRYARGITYKKFLSTLHSFKYKFLFAAAQFYSCFSFFKQQRKKRRRLLFNQIIDQIDQI